MEPKFLGKHTLKVEMKDQSKYPDIIISIFFTEKEHVYAELP